ncbi:OLC1v1025289C1 [Oldenlandia corymbosa var. corymbosa]|uniref:OLC1v1025289C1 n=1 Tax=Oldenlandia corymbosa var. corymbosa TaxID=529605 RepID=A0AAV1C6R7_OLDCO|nr:OLC1v1025289C1 [Oldenlandia corymbosa var. corymbosa]
MRTCPYIVLIARKLVMIFNPVDTIHKHHNHKRKKRSLQSNSLKLKFKETKQNPSPSEVVQIPSKSVASGGVQNPSVTAAGDYLNSNDVRPSPQLQATHVAQSASADQNDDEHITAANEHFPLSSIVLHQPIASDQAPAGTRTTETLFAHRDAAAPRDSTEAAAPTKIAAITSDGRASSPENMDNRRSQQWLKNLGSLR